MQSVLNNTNLYFEFLSYDVVVNAFTGFTFYDNEDWRKV